MSEIPRDIPAEARDVYLYRNSIRFVPAGVLDHLSLCEVLDMRRNEISSIDPLAFVGMISLIEIELRQNKIHNIIPGTFLKQVYVTHLYMPSNLITVVKYGTFKGLKSLLKLSLGDNKILRVEPGGFDFLYSVQEIYLYENKLTSVSADLFLNLPRPLQLILSSRYAMTYYDCTSLCWMKHEEQHGTVVWKDKDWEEYPICVGDYTWTAPQYNTFQCGNPGEFFNSKSTVNKQKPQTVLCGRNSKTSKTQLT